MCVSCINNFTSKTISLGLLYLGKGAHSITSTPLSTKIYCWHILLTCPAGKLHSNEEHIPDDSAWSDLWCTSSVCDHRWHTDMSFSLSFSTHMIAHGLKRRRRRKQNKQKNDAISRAICLKRFTHGATLSIIYCAAGGLFTAHMLLCYATNCHLLCVCVYWCCACAMGSGKIFIIKLMRSKLVAADFSFIAELNCVCCKDQWINYRERNDLPMTALIVFLDGRIWKRWMRCWPNKKKKTRLIRPLAVKFFQQPDISHI